MRIIRYLLWAVMVAFICIPKPLHARDLQPAVIEGRIISGETGEPLERVHVFLSGTTRGTITNEAGRFRLARVSPGAYRLAISRIGYARTSLDILVREGETITVDRRLQPVVYEMDPVYVEDLDDEWERDMERFTRLFIGETKWADSVEITNPEVLRFETKWWGMRFSAEALAPLEIENRALGYRITFFLDDFRHSGHVTRWDGEPLFEEMTAESTEQAERWEENREEAFYGSMRHLMLALIHDRVNAEGFILIEQDRGIRGSFSRRSRRASANRLISPDDDQTFFDLDFSGRLEVTYTEAPEDRYYLRWAREFGRAPAGSQTSYMDLNIRPVTIDHNGSILQTYGTTVHGYFSFRRVAVLTPREYLPEELEPSLQISAAD